MDKIKLLKAIFQDEADEDVLKQYVPFVDEAISTLDERQQCVIQKRFGGETLRGIAPSIAKILGVNPCDGISAERVRQIEYKALKLLRQPSRKKILRGEISASDFINSTFITKDTENKKLDAGLLDRSEQLKGLLIKDIELSCRTRNCLENASIDSVGDLILKSEKEMLCIKNLGRKSLNEIREILWELGLKFMGS